eukprot:2200119-Amphidinium_carterae.1
MLVGEVSRDARNSQDMHVACYADADLSGDSTRTAKSTTGYWRQTSTSVSTAEAELVAMTSAVKESAIPAQVLLAVAFGKGVPLKMYEDNDACSSVVKSGYSPKLRHLVRTQRTSIGMLSEVLLPHEIGTAEIMRIGSANQKADALTKPLIGDKFQTALEMMNIRNTNAESEKCLPSLERFEDATP